MKYADLLEEALLQLPKFKKQYEEDLLAGNIDADDGMHIVFCEVFMPVLHDLIDEKDSVSVNNFFSFVEKMENSGDPLVAEVAEFTGLEDLCDNYNDKDFLGYLGENTKDALKQIRKYIPESA